MQPGRCMRIRRNNGACCWRAAPSASRVARRSRSARAISGARPAAYLTQCAPAPRAPACSTFSARRGPNTGFPAKASAKADATSPTPSKRNTHRPDCRVQKTGGTMPIRRRSLLRSTLAAGLATPAVAAANWPTQTPRLVCPFAAGGPTDAAARSVAEGLGPVLGQRVVVENRTGAGVVVGTDAVAKARDGHTFLYTTIAHAVLRP